MKHVYPRAIRLVRSGRSTQRHRHPPLPAVARRGRVCRQRGLPGRDHQGRHRVVTAMTGPAATMAVSKARRGRVDSSRVLPVRPRSERLRRRRVQRRFGHPEGRLRAGGCRRRFGSLPQGRLRAGRVQRRLRGDQRRGRARHLALPGRQRPAGISTGGCIRYWRHCRDSRLGSAVRNHISDLRGAGRLAIDATAGITGLVEALHTTIASTAMKAGGPGRRAGHGGHHVARLPQHPRRHAGGRRRHGRRAGRARARPRRRAVPALSVRR